MFELRKYLRKNNRTLRKKYRKTLITPLLQKIHYLQNLQKMNLNFFKNHFLNKKAFFLYSLVLFYFFAFRDFAWAAPAATGEAKDVALSWLVDFLNLWIWVLTFLITPLIMLAGWLLSPDWTFWDIFGLRPVIHGIWILVSNVVYIVFAFVLVFIAFMNIFWESKNYAIKSNLPKLVAAILIVPFTWFIVSFVLSVSNILVASVIQLPMETILKTTDNEDSFLNKPIIPKNITYDNTNNYWTGSSFGSNLNWAWWNGSEIYSVNWNFYASDCDNDESWCISIKDLLTSWKWWAYNMLSVYAYWIFKIQNYKQIDKSEIAQLKFLWDLAKKLSFWIIFFVMFWVLVVSIVYALFSRAVMLWLYAIFSPLFALTWFFTGKWWEGLKKLEKHMTIQKFISLALVPVYVSAALSFWLVFLGATINWSNASDNPTWQLKWDNVNITTDDKTQTQTFTFWSDKATAVTFKTIWVLNKQSTSWINTALDMWKWIISTIIINILALVILWMAVMAALQANEITWSAIKPIADFWASIWKLALESPKYIPLKIPGTDGKSISLAWMSSLWQNIEWAVRQAAIWESWKLWTAFWDKLAGAMWYPIDKHISAMQEIITKWPKSQDMNWASKFIEDLRSSTWVNFDEFSKDKQKRALFAEWITKIGDNIIWKDEKEKLIKELKDWDSNSIKKALIEVDKHKGNIIGKSWEQDVNSPEHVEEWWNNWITSSKQITIKSPENKQPLSEKNTVVKIKWEIDGKKDQEKTIDIWLFKSWWNYYKSKDANWKFTDKVDNIKEHVSAKLSENWINPEDKIIWIIL